MMSQHIQSHWWLHIPMTLSCVTTALRTLQRIDQYKTYNFYKQYDFRYAARQTFIFRNKNNATQINKKVNSFTARHRQHFKCVILLFCYFYSISTDRKVSRCAFFLNLNNMYQTNSELCLSALERR